MEYRINNTVKYNAIDGTLFSSENSVDMLTLARISNELLLLFIQNNGALLSRDTILNELWEKRGLSASSNNLNNHISILRKALAECGCASVITTVPKQGFLFVAEIITLAPTAELHSSIPVLYENGVVNNQGSSNPIIKEKRTSPSSLLLNISLSVVFILVVAATYSLYECLRLKSIRNEVLRINQCRFYLIDDLTRRMPGESITDRIKTIIKDEKLNCDLEANVYYSADKKLDSNGKSTFHDFLSYCPYDSKAPCENYIFTRNDD